MTSPQPVPAGMHTVTPHLVCDNAAAAIDFYVRAFGATISSSPPLGVCVARPSPRLCRS